MPNPLILSTSSTASAAKSETAAKGHPISEGADTFAEVMEQELQRSEGDSLNEDVPELTINAEVQVEEDVVEEDSVDLATSLSGKPETDPPARASAQDEEMAPEETPASLPEPDKAVILAAPNNATPDPRGDALGNAAQRARSEVPALLQAKTAQQNPEHNLTQTAIAKGYRTKASIPSDSAPGKPEVPEPKLVSRDTPDAARAPKATGSPPTTQSVPAFVQIQLMASAKVQDVDLVSDPDAEGILPARESQPFSTARDTSASHQHFLTSARAETARAIAGQMAAAIHARPQSGTIELTLNPEELGKISIVMNGRDDGLQMTIAAERPETLEMMRRHLSVLEAEFKNLGLGDLSFNLGASSDDQPESADKRTESGLTTTQTEMDQASEPVLTRIGHSGRVDMRL